MGRGDIENPSPRHGFDQLSDTNVSDDQLSDTNVSVSINQAQGNPSSIGDYSKHIEKVIAGLEAELDSGNPDQVHVELQAANTLDSNNPNDEYGSEYASSTRTTEDLGLPAKSAMSAQSSLSAISGANGSARSKTERRGSFLDDLEPVAPAAPRPSVPKGTSICRRPPRRRCR